MAITVTRYAQTGGSANSTLTITAPASGSLLVMFVAQLTSIFSISGGDNSGSGTWTTNATSATFGAAGVDSIWVMTKTANGSETSLTPTAGTGGTLQGLCYFELAAASTTLDGGSSFPVATNTTSTALTSQASTAFSTTNTGSVILVGVGRVGASGNISAWTSTVLTQAVTTTSRCFAGSLIPGTTETSITPTANWTTSGAAGLLAVAFTPPSTGNTQGLLVAF